jgi:Amt family ammonium transporter
VPPNSLMGDHANLVWALLACFLILFAHVGFALYETGLCRAKNASHTMAMNALVWPLCTIGFFVCGFAFMYGAAWPSLGLNRWLINVHGWGFLGGRGFFLHRFGNDPVLLFLFFFTICRMTITATIPSGALAERWRFKSFFIFSMLIGALLAPVYGAWIRGNGWLAQLGGVDYAGSSVIHMQGGVMALVATWMLGPRLGKYDPHGRPRPILGHNLPMAMLGCLVLAVAWLALNAAPSLAASDGRVFIIVVNSVLAASAGAIAACAYTTFAYGKPDPTMICNGTLGGLVAIAAACAFVAPAAALIIGVAAGVLAVWSVSFWERCGIDDPVGVISVHGVNGLWGLLALGLFADGTFDHVTGLFYGDSRQLLHQCIMAGACIAWGLIAGGLTFHLIGIFFGPNRVPREIELSGLDLPELGVPAYREMGSSGSSMPAFTAEPRPATAPLSVGQQRFSIVIEGVDSHTLIGAWSRLCQSGSGPPTEEFKEVYPYLTTVTGNRFRFSGGDPTRIKEKLSHLFQATLPDRSILAKLES